MSGPTPVLLTVWEMVVEADQEGAAIDIVPTARKVAAKHSDSGFSLEEICHLLERAAVKRGVPARRRDAHLVA